ncbi:transcription factor E2F5 isoform X2 [Pleuronectes platessa]|uniref:transcription factor E2F5 isoform X2 n=1 Tax=Pleuronectes platessa TaxID=8262 RepID=UPI00232A409B|nr:transcription factor E2F5 isoform X2 [Pleuronectes platessa]
MSWLVNHNKRRIHPVEDSSVSCVNFQRLHRVWLAALRETDKQDWTGQHVICEDHFLPEDISSNKVDSEAIPIMPPYLDGGLGLVSPWGAQSSEEEEQWTTGGREDEDEGGEARPAPGPPQQGPAAGLENPPEPETTSAAQPQRKRSSGVSRHDTSLVLLTQGFLELLLAAPGGSLDIRQVAISLKIRKRRVYDITNILNGIKLIQKESANRIKWIGEIPISSFLSKNQQRFQKELENLQRVEDTLDGLIKSCAQQLFDMTDDLENSASAYVTLEDLGRLRVLQDQTLVVIKAPEETKLEIPAPKEDNIQVHLKAGKGPITVVTREMDSVDALTSDPGRTGSGFFLTLEESRVRTSALYRGDKSLSRRLENIHMITKEGGASLIRLNFIVLVPRHKRQFSI